MAYARRSFSDTAVTTTLSGGIDDNDTAITIAEATGWPTHANGPFLIQIESEVIEITARTGTSLTAGTRGVGSTAAASHSSGVAVTHVITGETDMEEANYTTQETVGKISAAGQLLIGDAANSLAALDVKTSGRILVGNGTTAASVAVSGDATLSSAGALTVANSAITTSKINDGAVTNAKAGFTAGAWTPTVTQVGAVAKTVTYGEYVQLGELVIARCVLTFSGSGTAGTGIVVTLPVNSAHGSGIIGQGDWFDTSATGVRRFLARCTAAGTMDLMGTNEETIFPLGNSLSSVGLAIENGDVISINLSYFA